MKIFIVLLGCYSSSIDSRYKGSDKCRERLQFAIVRSDFSYFYRNVELLLQFALNFGTDLTLAAGFVAGKFTVRPSLCLICLPLRFVPVQFGNYAGNRGIKCFGLELAFPDGDDAPGE